MPVYRCETAFIILDDAAGRPGVKVDLIYLTDDPYAVRIVFLSEDHPGDSIAWTVSREQLHQGLIEPVGMGDVYCGPVARPPDTMLLTLKNDETAQDFWVPAGTLARFLDRTYALVPPGDESRFLDLDSTIAKLLSGI